MPLRPLPFRRSASRPHRQDGVSLVVILILMSALFLVTAFGARLTLMGEKSSRNDRDRQIAFQAAEAALSDAELDLMGPNAATNSRVCTTGSKQVSLFVEGCGNTNTNRGFCTNSTTQPLYKSIDFEETGSSRRYVTLGEYTGGRQAGFATDTSALPAKMPRYIIEVISYARPRGTNETAFLITSLGYGLNSKTQVMMQSVVYKPEMPGC